MIFDEDFFQINKLSYLHNDTTIVFCKTDYLIKEFEKISNLKNKCILISGNSDFAITETITQHLPENVYHWYAQNNLVNNPKITTIPIGLENDFWSLRVGHGGPPCGGHSEIGFKLAQQKKNILKHKSGKNNKSNRFIYANFTIQNNHRWRSQVSKLCKELDFITYQQERLGYEDFFSEMCDHKMVLCPLGNAPHGQADNLRIYETLYCGLVPIVFMDNQSILAESLYSKLPIIILKSLQELNDKELINEKYNQVKNNKKEIIYYSYWLQEIEKKVKEMQGL